MGSKGFKLGRGGWGQKGWSWVRIEGFKSGVGIEVVRGVGVEAVGVWVGGVWVEGSGWDQGGRRGWGSWGRGIGVREVGVGGNLGSKESGIGGLMTFPTSLTPATRLNGHRVFFP